MMDIVTIGETMLRLTAPSPYALEQTHHLELEVAGSESNVAIGLSRLGMRAGWVSRLVDNPLGRRIANKIREHGVDVSHVAWTDTGRVGVYFVELGPSPRQTQVFYDRANSAMALMTPEEVNWAYVRSTRVLHLTGITPALSPSCRAIVERALDEAHSAGATVSFDVNYRSKLWSPEEARVCLEPMLPRVDVLFCSLGDAIKLFGSNDSPEDAAHYLSKQFKNEIVVVTAGGQGAVACQHGQMYAAGGYPVEVADPIGAGDAFDAGFLYGYLTDEVEHGLKMGTALAALQMTYPGDIAWCTAQEVHILAQGNRKEIAR